jgi:BlaI family transcriptional regulator, penicillinase repressor
LARPASERPTELELDILKILWDDSPLPVRDVRRRLEERGNRTLAHSSVITMLNIMVQKGYLSRRKRGKAFFFSPKVKRDDVCEGFVADLLGRVFDGSAAAMMLNLIETADLDAEEMNELRKLIYTKIQDSAGEQQS